MYLSLIIAATISLVIALKWDKMDYKEKILAGILILIVFSYAMNHYKNQQMEEAYENMNRSEIEIKSSDFSDLNQEELKILKEEMEEVERIEEDERMKKNESEDMTNITVGNTQSSTTQPHPVNLDADLIIPKDLDNQKKIEKSIGRKMTFNEIGAEVTTIKTYQYIVKKVPL